MDSTYYEATCNAAKLYDDGMISAGTLINITDDIAATSDKPTGKVRADITRLLNLYQAAGDIG